MKHRYIIPIIVLTCAWQAAFAQVVRGVVRDAERRPLTDISVELLLADGAVAQSARSGAGGTFAFAVTAGRYRAVARRLGFTPVTSDALEARLGDTLTVELTFSGIPVLDTVVVEDTKWKLATGKEVLQRHVRAEKGTFVPGSLIRASGKDLSEYLGGLEGLWLTPLRVGRTSGVMVSGGRRLYAASGNNCLAMRIDYRMLSQVARFGPPKGLDERIKLSQLEAIEFYKTIADVPPEWKIDALRTASSCAFIQLWTNAAWDPPPQ